MILTKNIHEKVGKYLNSNNLIAELSRNLNTFSLQNVGTFQCERKGARYDAEVKRIIPPSVFIHYSAQVDFENDNASVYLQKKYAITAEESLLILTSLSDWILEELESKLFVEIGNYGQLTKKFGEISYQSYVKRSETPSISSPKTQKKLPFHKISEINNPSKQETKKVEKSKAEPQKIEVAKNEIKNNSEINYFSFGILALFVLIVLSTFAVFREDFEAYFAIQSGGNYSALNQDLSINALNEKIDKFELNFDKIPFQYTKINVSASSSSETTSSTNVASTKKFHIVVGTASTKKDAEKEVKKLKAKNYSASFIKNGKNYRIIAGSFEKNSVAKKQLAKIQATLSKDAWLIIK